jgi:hypothetical protein
VARGPTNGRTLGQESGYKKKPQGIRIADLLLAAPKCCL